MRATVTRQHCEIEVFYDPASSQREDRKLQRLLSGRGAIEPSFEDLMGSPELSEFRGKTDEFFFILEAKGSSRGVSEMRANVIDCNNEVVAIFSWTREGGYSFCIPAPRPGSVN